MLVSCSECGGQVSDKAVFCPQCGVEIKKRSVISTKRMRLPNGFGRITKLKGKNLRKPYRAMVSVGKDEAGRPIGKLLKPESYFATYNEAYTALMKYHESPYDFDNDITMSELFEKWVATYSRERNVTWEKNIRSMWSHCKPLYEKRVADVTTRIIREFLMRITEDSEDGQKLGVTNQVANKIKIGLSTMFDFALECEIVKVNPVKAVKNVAKSVETKHPHETFTDEEMKKIIEAAKSNDTAELILFNCYTGWRPDEMLELLVSNVNMKEWYIIGGKKTASGKDRKVPIHSRIRPILRKRYSEAIKSGSKYLFGKRFPYNTYLRHFKETCSELELSDSHRPHDCRKHFVTMAKKAGVDEYVIKRIVGHAIKDITESVYTDRDVQWLHKELQKIP